jgi:hypothetical protein
MIICLHLGCLVHVATAAIARCFEGEFITKEECNMGHFKVTLNLPRALVVQYCKYFYLAYISCLELEFEPAALVCLTCDVDGEVFLSAFF